jgi:hypothetical protein
MTGQSVVFVASYRGAVADVLVGGPTGGDIPTINGANVTPDAAIDRCSTRNAMPACGGALAVVAVALIAASTAPAPGPVDTDRVRDPTALPTGTVLPFFTCVLVRKIHRCGNRRNDGAVEIFRSGWASGPEGVGPADPALAPRRAPERSAPR